MKANIKERNNCYSMENPSSSQRNKVCCFSGGKRKIPEFFQRSKMKVNQQTHSCAHTVLYIPTFKFHG